MGKDRLPYHQDHLWDSQEPESKPGGYTLQVPELKLNPIQSEFLNTSVRRLKIPDLRRKNFQKKITCFIMQITKIKH